MQHRYKTMPEAEAKALITDLLAPVIDVSFKELGKIKSVWGWHTSGRLGPTRERASAATWGDCACRLVLEAIGSSKPTGQLKQFIDEWFPDWLDYKAGMSRLRVS
jgi:hypothetical protein